MWRRYWHLVVGACIVVLAGGVYAWKHSGNTAEDAYQRGLTLQKSQLLTEAEQAWKEAIKADPKDARPHAALGNLSLANRQYEQAEQAFQQAVGGQKLPAHTWCALAEAQWKQGAAAKALPNAEAELKLDARCLRAHLIAGQIYRQQGQSQKALEHLQQAAQLAPNEPTVQLVYASTLAKAQQYPEAETILRALIQKEAIHPDPYYWLGYCLARDNRDPKNAQEAEVNFLRAIQLEGGVSPEFHYELARHYLNIKRPAEAEQQAQKALRRRPAYQDALFTLAQAQRAQGKTAEAEATLQRFRKMSELGSRQRALLKTLAADRSNLNALVELGEVELQRGNLENAQGVAQEAARLAPDSPLVRSLLAKVKQAATAIAPKTLDPPRPQ